MKIEYLSMEYFIDLHQRLEKNFGKEQAKLIREAIYAYRQEHERNERNERNREEVKKSKK